MRCCRDRLALWRAVQITERPGEFHVTTRADESSPLTRLGGSPLFLLGAVLDRKGRLLSPQANHALPQHESP